MEAIQVLLSALQHMLGVVGQQVQVSNTSKYYQTAHLHQRDLIISRNILVAVNSNNMALLLVNGALLLISLVLVVLLSVNTTILDDEGEGEVHEAAMAAVVLSSVTVHQLLLAQGHQLL